MLSRLILLTALLSSLSFARPLAANTAAERPRGSLKTTAETIASPRKGRRIPIEPGDQVAWISWKAEGDASAWESETWRVFCGELGKTLSPFPGPGLLSSFTCSRNAAPSSGLYWHFEFVETSSTLEFKAYLVASGKSYPIRSWSFPLSGKATNFLSNRTLVNAFARLLIEGLPMGSAHKVLGDSIKMSKANQFTALPEKVLLSTLSFETGTQAFATVPYATLAKKADESPESDTYIFESVERPTKPYAQYWARPLDAGKRLVIFQEQITRYLNGSFKVDRPMDAPIPSTALPPSPTAVKAPGKGQNPLDSFLPKSTYIGIRYGRSLQRTEDISSKTQFISVMAEVGSSFLSGLRAYYDVFPKIKETREGAEEYFSLSRIYLGYAFRWDAPGDLRVLMDTFDLAPKLGLLSFDSRFAIDTGEFQYRGIDFQARKVFDLAIEIGGEKEFDWGKFRYWGSASTANLGVRAPGEVSLSSRKAGLDIYYDLYRSKSWNLTLLAFANLEKLTLNKEIDWESTDIAIDTLNMTTYFGGVGISVSF